MKPLSAALALSLSLPFMPAALGAQARDLRDRVPASAWGYVQFEGLESCRKAFDRLPESSPFRALMKALRDKGLLDSMEDWKLMGMDQTIEGVGQLGHSVAEIRALATRPMVLVVGRPTLIPKGMLPSMMLMVDVAKAEKETESLLSTLATVTATLGGASLSELRNPRITVARYREGPGKVAWTVQDKVLYISLGDGLLRDALATSAGKKPALKLPALIQKSEASLGAGPEFSIYLDLRKVQDSIGWLMPYEALEIGRIFGIQGIEGWYYGAAATKKGIVEVDRLLIPGNKGGLAQQLLSQPTQCAAAGLAEKDTLLFTSFQLDTRGMGEALRQIFPLLPPKAQDKSEREFRRSSEQIEQVLGMDAEELVAQFSGEWSLALQAPRGSEIFPDVLLFVPIKNRDKVMGMIQNLIAMTPGTRLRDQTVGDEHVYVISLPKKVRRKVPLTPAFTFKNGFMIWSPNARRLKSQARHWPTPEESYAGSTAFQKLRQGTQGASSLLFLHLQTGFARIWDNKTLKGMALMAINKNNEGLGLHQDDLPTSAELAPLFQDASFSCVWDENGPVGRAENNPLSHARILVYGATFLDWFLEETVKSEIH